jgi:ectoine hydroxylase-related dioxygenase (phytanoyl-CoA dioxygenase family)
MVERMRSRFDELLARNAERLPTNRGAQRYQMYVPWEPPFDEPLLYENPVALAVMEAAMEPDLCLRYFASDTPLPGSDYQQVHSDTRLLFPETQLSLPCYGIALNVPLVDCTEENGSLEFWPSTHLMPGRSDLGRLAASLPSARANFPAGSILLRDLRMWHRGTPNRSTGSRPHLALVYTRPWYRFELDPPLLDRAQYEALSERAQRLLRHAPVCDSAGVGEPARGQIEGGTPPA